MYFIKKGGCMHNHLYYKRKQEEIKGLGESYFLLDSTGRGPRSAFPEVSDADI